MLRVSVEADPVDGALKSLMLEMDEMDGELDAFWYRSVTKYRSLVLGNCVLALMVSGDFLAGDGVGSLVEMVVVSNMLEIL